MTKHHGCFNDKTILDRDHGLRDDNYYKSTNTTHTTLTTFSIMLYTLLRNHPF